MKAATAPEAKQVMDEMPAMVMPAMDEAMPEFDELPAMDEAMPMPVSGMTDTVWYITRKKCTCEGTITQEGEIRKDANDRKIST